MPELLLALGAGLGALLAASGLMGGADARARPLPPEAVARVNGDLIRLDEFQRAVNGLTQDRRGVGVILVQPYQNRKTAETVARQTGAEVLDVPQQPGAIPDTDSYLALIDHMIATIAGGLEVKR